MDFTPKQRDLMRLWQRDELKRINLLEGSVSSGKTWVSLVLWAFWVATRPADKLYLMCAKSLTTLKRNCLILLQELVGQRNFTFSIPAKEGYLFGRRVLFEGANDARSESKIRGMTLQGAYCDELTQFPEDFFAMLLSRLRVPGAKLIATTNPDSPNHWLMTEYINRADELDFLDVKFTIDDNTTLDPEYVRNIKAEYVGVFYNRFILGMWTAAEGAVYHSDQPGVELFADAPDKYIIDDIPTGLHFPIVSIGVDFGGTGSATKFQATGITRDWKVYAIDEVYIKGAIDPAQLNDRYTAFVQKITDNYGPSHTRADSAEQILINGFFHTAQVKRLRTSVKNAMKIQITDRIRLTLLLMAQGRLFVTKQCAHLIDAFKTAVYDDNGERLDDGTSDIDSLDAFEYSIEPYYKQLETAGHRGIE